MRKIRGTIGANQSCIETALGGIVASRAYIAAGLRIADANFAQEAASLVRTTILQQAAWAALTQANQGHALALELLR